MKIFIKMINSIMRLYELFNQDIDPDDFDIEWDGNTDETYVTFDVNGTKYDIMFTRHNLSQSAVKGIFSKDIGPMEGYEARFGLLKDGYYNYNVTKTGNQFTVLNIVIQIIKQFAGEIKDSRLYPEFSQYADPGRKYIMIGADSNEPSRVKLYQALVNRFRKSENVKIYRYSEHHDYIAWFIWV